MSDYLTVSYKPNFKVVGKTLGSSMGEFTKVLSTLSEEDARKIENGTFDVNGNTIDNTCVLKDITSKDGYQAVMLNYKKVAINTTLTRDLINEGIAREIVSKIQNLRKTSDFDISDRISFVYNGPDEIVDAVNEFKDYIMNEVLAVTLEEDSKADTELKINDYTMNVTIKQIKK